MSYMDDFERDLVNVLEEAPDQKTVINFVKNKMLESYRNGMSAAKNSRPTGATGLSLEIRGEDFRRAKVAFDRFFYQP